MRVLVTDGASRVALAVVRALGAAGARVVVVEQERHALRTPAGFRSRHVVRREVVPSLDRREAFVDAVSRLAEEVDVVLPVSTNVLFALAGSRDRIPARLPVPPLETLRRANDKSRLLAAARKVGVAAPATSAPEDEGDLDQAIAGMTFPAVVKLRDDEGTELDPADRYAVGRTPGEVRAAWRALHRRKPFPIVQEYVDGEGCGVGLIAEDGRILASVTHRRVREWPVTGGPSAACETARDPELLAAAAALVRELRWTGAAMVEFRGRRLMEMNPRWWGALPLALAAGINLPAMLCRRALGEAVEPADEPPPGVRLRFLPLDVAAVVGAWSHPRKRWSYLLGFARDLVDPRVHDGILDWRDLDASLTFFEGRLP